MHLPTSPGATSDDKILQDLSVLDNKIWVITEKMDGENTTMMNNCIYARSLDSNNHPSRNWVKGLWGEISYKIPEGWRICGENIYAKHSIEYDNLESYFLVYSIWNEDNICLQWDDTEDFCSYLGLNIVKVLGLFTDISNLDKEFIPDLDLNKQEGVVLRNFDSFHYDTFQENVFKWVRPNHVQTDKHWSTQSIIKNKLKT